MQALLRVTVAQTLKIKPLPLPRQITAGQNLHSWRIWQRKETENKDLESYKANEGIDTTNSDLIPLQLPHLYPVGVTASHSDTTTYTTTFPAEEPKCHWVAAPIQNPNP